MSAKIICTENEITYPAIRKAMVGGARTVLDLIQEAGVCGACEGCKENLPYITATLCGCKEVSMERVISLVQQGVTSVEEIATRTGAGTGEECGRCVALVENIIELGY